MSEEIKASATREPDVTVAVMSYNNARYLGATIDSILAQTGVSFEVIVVDDCSSDESVRVLEKYVGEPNFRFEVNSSNLGQVGNYNKCVDSGVGKYIVVLGSDDVLYPNHLASLCRALAQHSESVLAYAQCNWIDENGCFIKRANHFAHFPQSYFGRRDEVIDLLRYDNYITPSAVMLRRQALDSIRRQDGSLAWLGMSAADWELWIRIARKYPNFIFLHQASVGYRIHGAQVSQTFYQSEKPLTEHMAILEDNLNDPATRRRMRVARDDIWALLMQRVAAYPTQKEKHADRVEKIRQRLFSPDGIESMSENIATPRFQPLVSVVMPTHNRPNMLEVALASVCEQTYTNWEAIVVNDAGESVERVILSSTCRDRITLINHGANKGLSAARNTALRQARGEIICYLDDDDLFKPDHLAAVVDALTDLSRNFVYFDAEYVSEQVDGANRVVQGRGIHSPNQAQQSLLIQNFIPINAWAHRRACLAHVGDFDETLRTHEDWDLLIRFSLRYELVHVPCVTVEVRQRVTADNMLRTVRLLDTFDLIYKRYPVQGEEAANARRKTLAYVANRDRSIPRGGIFPAQWNEQEYLRLNPDVAESVNAGALDSGYSHFLAYGQFESQRTVPQGWGGHERQADKAQAVSGFAEVKTQILDRVFLGLQRLQQNKEALRNRPWASYARWLERARITPSSPLFSGYVQRPALVRLWVLVSGADDEAALARSLESLDAQLRRADRVCLVHEQAFDDLPQDADSWLLLLCAGDILEPDALLMIESAVAGSSARLAYFDHDGIDASGRCQAPSIKPGANPDLLLSCPYVGRSLALRADVAGPRVANVRCFNLPFAYELTLSVLLEHGQNGMLHVPALLAHLSDAEPAVFVETTPAWQAMAGVLSTYLQKCEPGAQVLEGPGPGTFHVIHPLHRTPKVSIVIPTRDQLPFLSRCIESLLDKTDYPDYEILVVDNDSQTAEAQAFLAGMEVVDPERIRVLRVPGQFNFSKLNNLAVAQARGEFILLLNNDTAALHADWLSHMMRHALRDGVGVVGARLLYPEGTVQHAGVIMGLRGPAEHPCLGLKADEPGYMFRAQLTQNFSAVTAACMLVSKAVYEAVGGLDEDVFAVSYNDVDFCLRVGKTGRRIVWTPLATLLHEGSASQKADIENIAKDKKAKRFTREQAVMYERWPEVIANDPAYNPNLSLVERGYEVETNPLLCYDPLKGLVDHRVVAFAADAFGCGNYRILQPMQAMLDAGLCTGGASPELFGPNLALRSGADTLVFQRPSSDSDLALLESLLPLKNIKKIYEVDDDLSRVPMKSAHREHMPKDIRARMMRNIGLCDRLVVSTETLAHQLRGSNDDIRVVLNRLPLAMWGDAPPTKQASERVANKPRVGWAGGISHQGDLELIAQVVRDTADQVDWVFFGMCPEVIRPYVKEFYAGVPTLEYPKRLMELAQSWDLAVAPLEINPFNDSKSNLRLLEYGWCGLPVVCSDITPYQGDLPVRRVKNRYKDWRAAILEAVSEREASRQMGQALQQRVHSDWMLKGDNLTAWYEAWTGN